MVATGSAVGQGGPITDAMKPILAATRIFALENHLHGDIGVADADEGHIGESFEVNHAPNQTCTFTMRHRDGPVIESISFDHLSGEYRTSRQGGYTLLVISGRPGAQCNISGGSKKCSSDLEMLLIDDGSPPTELDLAARALRYIFSNVCQGDNAAVASREIFSGARPCPCPPLAGRHCTIVVAIAVTSSR